MTTPAGPATGAEGAAPATGSDPTTTTATTPDATETDVDWQAEAERWKKQARNNEERAKANKKALDELNASRQPKDGEPTADDWQKQLTEAQEAREAAETRAAELAFNTTVMRVAGTVGADHEALLDSGAFLSAVEQELGDDFDDDELTAAVTKVAREFAKKPRFAKQTGAPRAGSDISGGTPPPPRQRAGSMTEAIKAHYGRGSG